MNVKNLNRKHAFIRAIEYSLPEGLLTNEMLETEFPEWSVQKIKSKTGIDVRHIAGPDECASDLGTLAAEKLFSNEVCHRKEIDYLLFCTQSPDHFLPTTACIIQERLGLPKSCGALDFNLGCSGYIYGLGLAKGLLETNQARNVLLITAETYSKHIHPADKSVRTLFGDGAAATLLQIKDNESDLASEPYIGPFVYGTDGSGSKNLIVPTGGFREKRDQKSSDTIRDENGNVRSRDNLYMNGSEIFTFTLKAVPKCVNSVLLKSNKTLSEIDLFVFHQASHFMLEHLRKKIKIPAEKFLLSFQNFGNTVSSTIPIALKDAEIKGQLKPGFLVLLVGFGVGYSWGGVLVRWNG